jgi:ABC-type lipoprotein export system ATPase subunit
MAYLEARKAGKVYESNGARVQALIDASFTAERGEWLAITGRSGCGKSTLLNLCGAMDFPTTGAIEIDGETTSCLDDGQLTRLRRSRVGFVFQSFQLLHTLSVIENVEVPLLLAGTENARDIARERLAWVDLPGIENRMPYELSGGQQQRVAIARALAANPSILLADEPTGNLDTATGEIILSLLERAAHERSAVVLMATHSAEFAALADRVVKMRDGRIEHIA